MHRRLASQNRPTLTVGVVLCEADIDNASPCGVAEQTDADRRRRVVRKPLSLIPLAAL
jgi:hypothetical protein